MTTHRHITGADLIQYAPTRPILTKEERAFIQTLNDPGRANDRGQEPPKEVPNERPEYTTPQAK